MVAAHSETALLAAAAVQPIAVSLCVDDGFQNYASGVYTAPCCTSVNHAVLLTGYGSAGVGLNYWTIKNTWSTSWGEGGYIRLGRGAAYGTNGQCGLLMQGGSSFPTGPIGSPAPAASAPATPSVSRSRTPSTTPQPSVGASLPPLLSRSPSSTPLKSQTPSLSLTATKSPLGARVAVTLATVLPASAADPAASLTTIFDDTTGTGATISAVNVDPKVMWGWGPGTNGFCGELAFQVGTGGGRWHETS